MKGKWQGHFELDPVGSGSFHYLSAIQASAGAERKSNEHARFNLQWAQEKE